MRRVVLLCSVLAFSGVAGAAQTKEERSLQELRNTVVNLLQGLVEKGVLTREQAQAMVQAAQDKAVADAAAQSKADAEQAKAEEGAIRVPYVPEIVKDEISRQVATDLKPQVTQEVIEQAKSQQWGVPGALPDWIRNVRLSGDMRLRGESDLYATDNLQNAYLDFLTINDKGGIGKAGPAALLNTEEDRQRLRVRARLGIEADFGGGFSGGVRLTTGNLRDPVSTNQTLGNTGARYQAQFDLAYLKWTGYSSTWRQILDVSGGRIPNPWVGTELVWDQDLNFEGLASRYRLGLGGRTAESRYAFLTLGAFPIQEVELSTKDKWLLGGQLGLEWKTSGGNTLRLAAAYYDYVNIVGRLNAPASTLLDFTAPQFLQKGNTLYDIRNDLDPSTNLFALAADYKLADVTASFDWRMSPRYKLGLTGDFVRNVGYKEADVQARTGLIVPARTKGYLAELNFGAADLGRPHAWRGFMGYRYVERDAVLDAFTDSDFHLGGTDAKGYYIGGDFAFTPRTFLRLRYLSANEIDGPPLGIDVLQLDVNARF